MAFYLMVANVNSVLGQLQDEIGMVAFVDEDASAVQVSYLFDRIMTIPGVQIAIPISPEENQHIIEYLFGAEMVDDLMRRNPFLRAFSVEIIDLGFHDDVLAALWALDSYGISSVRSEQVLAETLWSVVRVVQTISLVVIFVLGLISLVIIINTIRITVGTRQAEISIMKYVGATDWFIRWPFVIEGMIIGLVGAAIPVAVCIFGYDSVISAIAGVPMLDFMYLLPGSMVLFYVVPFALGLGMFIGFIGSVVSIRQYLKV